MKLTKRQRSDLVASLRAGAEALEGLARIDEELSVRDDTPRSRGVEQAIAQAKRLRRYAELFEDEKEETVGP